MRIFDGVDQLRDSVGSHLGYSGWHEITQEQINLFADASGDHQWIHVDQERAKTGPFGTTIAHGNLTFSLAPALVAQVYRVHGPKMLINYGLNKVRFPAPTPVGSRVRAGVELLSVENVSQGSRVTVRVTMEREGVDKPSCVVETVTLMVV